MKIENKKVNIILRKQKNKKIEKKDKYNSHRLVIGVLDVGHRFEIGSRED